MVQRVNFSISTLLGGVSDPALAQDAATKNYVDTRPAGTINYEVPGVYTNAVITQGNVVLATAITAGTISSVQVTAGIGSGSDLANYFNNIALSQIFKFVGATATFQEASVSLVNANTVQLNFNSAVAFTALAAGAQLELQTTPQSLSPFTRIIAGVGIAGVVAPDQDLASALTLSASGGAGSTVSVNGVAVANPNFLNNPLTLGGDYTVAASAISLRVRDADVSAVADREVGLLIGSGTTRIQMSNGGSSDAVIISQVQFGPVLMSVATATSSGPIVTNLNNLGAFTIAAAAQGPAADTLVVANYLALAFQIQCTFPAATTLAQVQARFGGLQSDQVFAGTATQGTFVFQSQPRTEILRLAGTVAGTPAGANTQIQFNNNGVFGGSPNLTWNGTQLGANIVSAAASNVLSLRSDTGVRIADNNANFVGINGTAAGSSPSIASQGSDTNINLIMYGRGTGGIQLGTASNPTPLIVADSPTQSPAITLTPGVLNQVLTSSGPGKTPYWGVAGGGSSGLIFDLGQPLIADNVGLLVKISSNTPFSNAAVGTINSIADLGAVNITSPTWPPVIPAGFNQNFIGISSSDNALWGGVGRVQPGGIDLIAWVKKPAAIGAFTGGNIWFVSSAIASMYSAISNIDGQDTRGPVTSILTPELTHVYASDGLGGQADTITTQPFIDGRIATQIGQTPLTYTSAGVGSVSTGFGNAGTTWQAATANYAAARTALATTGAVAPVGAGNWTLPSYAIRISNIAAPSATQFATITQIQDNPTNSVLVITFSGNPAYFANAGANSQPLFTQTNKFTFVAAPQAEVIRLAQVNTVASIQGLMGVVGVASPDGTIGISTSGQNLNLQTSGGSAGATNSTTFITQGADAAIGMAGAVGFASTNAAVQNAACVGFGMLSDQDTLDGGYIGATKYLGTTQTMVNPYGWAALFPIATTYADLQIEIFNPSYTFNFTTQNAAAAGDFMLDAVLFSRAGSTAASPPDLNANLFPGFAGNGSDDIQLIPSIPATLFVTGSGTNWSATVTNGAYTGIINNYAHLLANTTVPYIAWLRVLPGTGNNITSVSNIVINPSAPGAYVAYLSLSGSAGATPSWNQVMGVGSNTAIPLVLQDLQATPRAITLSAPAAVSTSYTLKLPTAQATVAGQVLSNDAVGNLSWVTPSGGTSTIQQVAAAALLTDIITPSGQQTADGYVLVTGDYVLLPTQSDPTIQGLWIVSTTGPWTRVATTVFQPVFVRLGTINRRRQFSRSANNPASTNEIWSLTGISLLGNLQAVVNLGNSITNSGGIGSINISDVATGKTTTLDGAQVKAQSLVLDGSTTGSTTIRAAASTTSYSLTLPAAQATVAGQTLSNDGTGILSWASGAAANLQAVLNVGNSATNTGTNVSSILLTDSVSAKTTTLDGTKVESQSLILDGSTQGTVTLKAAANTTASYQLALPAVQGQNGRGLVNDGAGNLSWQVVLGTRQIRVISLVNVNPSGAQTVDGVVVVNNDTALLQNQADPASNGLYQVNVTNPWTRVTTFIFEGLFATAGTLNIGKTYSRTSDGAVPGNEIWILTAINAATASVSTWQAVMSAGNFINASSTGTPLILRDNQGTPNAITLRTPAAITASYALQLPTAQATAAGQTLSNDGTGILSWATPATTSTTRQIAAISTAPVVATGLLLIDGYQTVAGDYVLLVAQTDPISPTGLYIVSLGTWLRQTTIVYQSVFSLNGTNNGRKQYSRTAATPEAWTLTAITAATGGGTPGGLTTQFQYNNAGAFAGSTGLTFDSTNNRASALAPIVDSNVARLLDVTAATAGLTPQNRTNPVNIAEVEVVGVYTNNTGVGTATLVGNTQLVVAGTILQGGDEVTLVAQNSARLQNGSYIVTSNTASSFTLTRTFIAPTFGNFWVANNPNASNYGVQYENITTGTIIIGTSPIFYALFGVANLSNSRQIAAIATANVPAVSGVQVVDGYTTLAGDLILLASGQTTPANQGLWIVSTTGAWAKQSTVVFQTVFSLNGTVNGLKQYSRTIATPNEVWRLTAITSLAGSTSLQDVCNVGNITNTGIRLGTDTDLLSLTTGTISRSASGNLSLLAGNNPANQIILGANATTTVNRISISSGASGTGPTVSVNGSTNSDLNLAGIGTGGVNFATNFGIGIRMVGSNSTSVTPLITVVGPGNTGLTILAEGTGNVVIGNAGVNDVRITSGATTGVAPTIAPIGDANVGINLTGVGTGVVNLATSLSNSIRITPSTTGIATTISAVGDTDASLSISPSGNGFVTIGQVATRTGVVVVGSSTTQTQLQSSGVAANIDFVVTPKGTGDFYPIGPSPLSATVANQANILVASAAGSTTLSAGTAGQVLTSNGPLTGAPYWATPATANKAAAYSISADTNIPTGAQVIATARFTQQFNTLGITTGTNNYIVPANSGRLRLTFLAEAGSGTVAYVVYFAFSTSATIVTTTAFGTGTTGGTFFYPPSGFTSSATGGTPASTIILRPYGEGDTFTAFGVGYLNNSASAQNVYVTSYQGSGGNIVITNASYILFESVPY